MNKMIHEVRDKNVTTVKSITQWGYGYPEEILKFEEGLDPCSCVVSRVQEPLDEKHLGGNV